jgi:hypothetical protein
MVGVRVAAAMEAAAMVRAAIWGRSRVGQEAEKEADQRAARAGEATMAALKGVAGVVLEERSPKSCNIQCSRNQ